MLARQRRAHDAVEQLDGLDHRRAERTQLCSREVRVEDHQSGGLDGEDGLDRLALRGSVDGDVAAHRGADHADPLAVDVRARAQVPDRSDEVAGLPRPIGQRPLAGVALPVAADVEQQHVEAGVVQRLGRRQEVHAAVLERHLPFDVAQAVPTPSVDEGDHRSRAAVARLRDEPSLQSDAVGGREGHVLVFHAGVSRRCPSSGVRLATSMSLVRTIGLVARLASDC